MRLLGAAVVALAAAVCLRQAAFSQPSSLRGHTPSFQQPRGESVNGAENGFAGRSANFESAMAIAAPGCAMSLALVTMMGYGRKQRAKWRKAVNSENRGRIGYRADRRPPLFGPEKPPHEKKRIYHYYCNKMYKVIRFDDKE
ncbi:unnamed protein product [Symbiodinium natans]|uniref:Uncharacterized protein n=1 Tax=Symbiodinium natans TaxID=878477 RepID=A0A812SXV0_9DINO|nr:unnamed protein product [Symbiodinium natans]